MAEMAPWNRILAAAGLAALALGGCSTDGKVSWMFVSDPGGGSGGSGGGAVIVIRYSSSSASTSVGSRWVAVHGAEATGPVTVHLAVGGEHALLERPSGLELRAPVLPAAAVRLAGAVPEFVEVGPASLRIRALDVADLDVRATGPGVITVAHEGTLVLVEHAAGVLALGDGPARSFEAGSTVEEIGDGLYVRTAGPRLERILARPAPGTEERIRRPSAGRVDLIGPRGARIAALPEERVRFHGGAQGLFLTASFPEGLDSRTPTTLTATEGNRYLLRVDGP